MYNIKFRKFCIMAGFVAVSVMLCMFFWTNLEFVSATSVVAKGIPVKVKNKLCFVDPIDRRKPSQLYNKTDIKMIYFITPTYPRPEQVPELTRLGHTLMHVPRLHWIIADDEPSCSDEVLNILRRTGLPFTHLSSPKPYVYKTSNFPRGVSNRRAALDWIRENVHDGVLYFGDDDNTFDLRLFDEIRITKKVSMFPVGLIGGYGVSSPVVRDGKGHHTSTWSLMQDDHERTSDTTRRRMESHPIQIIQELLFKVVAFFDSWPGARTFPVDMAGFAVNIEFLKPSTTMPYIAGLEEDRFLISLGVNVEDIEPLADNCSKVFVWHTKTAKFKKPAIRINLNKLEKFSKYESFINLLKEITSLGMANIYPDNGTRPQITRNKKSYDAISELE